MVIMFPVDAPNDGARQLRIVLLRCTAGQVARRLGCMRSTVWRWARGTTPDPEHRGRLLDIFGIQPAAWGTTTDETEGNEAIRAAT